MLSGIACLDSEHAKELRLPNGLQVILQETPHSQVVCISLFVKAGSIHESESNHGVSRLCEKSLFRVTERHADVRSLIASYGGEYGSGMNQDFLYFSVTAGSAFLDPLFRVFEETIPHSQFSDSLVKLVQKDMLPRMEEEQKNLRIQIQSLFLKNAFLVHPYRLISLGSPKIFTQLTANDVRRYYESMFVPENLLLVITGHFDQQKVIHEIKSNLGTIEKKSPPSFVWEQEPPHKKTVRLVRTYNLPQQVAFVSVGWLAPSVQNPDTYTMDVFFTALGTGESSRLNRQIRSATPSVYSVWAEYRTPREPGYMMITAICEPSVAESVEKKILKEIKIIRDDSYTPKELMRAKQILAAQEAYSREGATDYGFYLGYWSTMANIHFAEEYIGHIQSITSEDVQKVAQTYLKDDNFVSIILLPGGKQHWE
jgi:zinc protease